MTTVDQAIAAHRSGKLAEAEVLYKKVLQAEPRHFDALHMLGIVYAQLGRFEEAESLLRSAVTVDPDFPPCLHNYGNVLSKLNRFRDAIDQYDRALKIAPNFAPAWSDRGNALLELDLIDDALASYDKAIALNPNFASAYYNRGRVLAKIDRTAEALASYDRAVACNPTDANAHRDRGLVLTMLKRYPEALASCERAAALDPKSASAWNALGWVHLRTGNHEKALEAYDKTFSIQPDFENVQGFRLHEKMHLCDWQNLEADIKRLLDAVKSSQLLTEPFPLLPIVSCPSVQCRYAAHFSKKNYSRSLTTLKNGGVYSHDRIRIAYLSADLRAHPVAYLMAGVFENHNHSRFSTTAISWGEQNDDAMRHRIRCSVDDFVDVEHKLDVDVANILREMEIDIAVDLMGHTTANRSAIFGYRPAPIQAAYLGYPGTTGADWIDYTFADDYVIPRSLQTHYSEKVVYLPDCFQSNDSKRLFPDLRIDRATAGLPEGALVFCCFNNSFKITPAIFDVWMRLLREVENSVLWILAGNEKVERNLRREAVARSVAPERLVFAPRRPYIDYLAQYRLADVFLDTLPFNAGTTASDALWLGVPLVTCSGKTFSSRMAGSLLRAAGLPELITHSLEEYEALALRLAREPDLLASYKAKLAANRNTCPLFDTVRFTRNLETAYIRMWKRHQRGEPPETFAVEGADG